MKECDSYGIYGVNANAAFLGDRLPHPNFRPMSIVAKTAGWIKMALGVEVGLGPSHIVLDEDPAPSPKGERGRAANFRRISVVAKQLHASRCHLLWR